MIKTYLEENHVSIQELSEKSGVSQRSIYRILSDESELSTSVALAIHELIPEIKVEFLVSYNAKYQMQKQKIEQENGTSNLNQVFKYFRYEKLYPNEKQSEAEKLEKLFNIFGKDVVNSMNVQSCPEFANAYFSKAKGAQNDASLIWFKAAEYDYRQTIKTPLSFNKIEFDKMLPSLKEWLNCGDFESFYFNLELFCKTCGINYLKRGSLPNSRIKAMSFKDKDGNVYLFLSDLFKCLENQILTFVHECIHISKGDLDLAKSLTSEENIANENYVDQSSADFFIGKDGYDGLKKGDDAIASIASIALDKKVSLGVVSEIYRYKFSDYSNAAVNKMIHYGH